ncbi:MAG: PHP domain-containing protein [Desulfobacterales bacterium]|nr:PHP domain-containing protein [Desulfobacterales bacterium]MDD4071569.1 PHP domain-containing protein [Desulfobacterales bacterium]MDD4391559.1 PHP domain-containing protein [Desulfobacterales bacterium]
MIFDTHVHTNLSSCSNLKIDDILTHAGARGLDGVCLTDHQTMDIRHHLKEGIQDNGLCVIVGMEYSTTDGDFLIFGPFETIEPGLPAIRLLEMVRQRDGIAIAAHPFRTGRSVSEFIIRDGWCDIVESVNGRNSFTENQKVDSWRQRYALTECCGSDAHALNELGKVTTCLTAPVRSRDDFIRAFKNGCCDTNHHSQTTECPHHQTSSGTMPYYDTTARRGTMLRTQPSTVPALP